MTITDRDLDQAGIADLGAVLAAGERPPQVSPLSASLTFGWRALLKIKHVPMQLADVTMFPIMFTVLFTYLFGGALAGSTREYLQQLLPGILVMTVVMITPYTGMGLNQDIQKGIFDRIKSLPVWGPAALVGALLGDVVRYTIAAAITVGLGLALGFRPGGGVVGVVLAVALMLAFSFALTWVWAAMGMKMETPENVMQVSMTILFPLTFASNVFVDPSTMPGWVQAFVDVNPITHLSTASRELMHGDPAGGSVLVVLLSGAAILAVFAPLTMKLYRAER